MPLNFDFTGVERKEGFSVLEPGTYTVNIADAVEKIKQGGEYPYLNLTLEVQEESAKVWDILTYHPNSVWRIRQLLEAIAGEEIDGPIQMNEKDLIGAELVVQLGKRKRSDNPDLDQNYVIAYKLPE